MLPIMIRKWRNALLRRNKNLLMLIHGPTGSGKSYSALVVGKMIDPSFDVNKQVVFNVEQFMRLLNSGTLRRGNVIIWDEAGVGIPSKEWYTISNKAIGYVMQTFRNMNLCVIFTTPTKGYIDKTIRVLFHVDIETIRIDYEKQLVVCKVKGNAYDSIREKTLNPYFRVGGVKKERINIAKPTKEMINAYESIKKAFGEELRADVEKDIHLERANIEHKRLTDMEIMRRIKEEQIPLDAYTIQFKFSVGKDRAYRIVNNYEKFSPSL